MDPSFSLEVYPDHPLDLVRARVRYQARGVNHPAPLTARMSVRGNPTAIVTTQPGKNFRYGREHGVELANHAGNRPLHGLLAFHDGPNWKAEANWIVPEISPWPGITYKLEARVLDREGTDLSGLLRAKYTA